MPAAPPRSCRRQYRPHTSPGQAHGRKDLRRDLLTDRSRDLLGHILLHGGSNSRADGRFLCIDSSRYLGKSRLISLLINGGLIKRSQRAVEHLGIVADRQLRDAEARCIDLRRGSGQQRLEHLLRARIQGCALAGQGWKGRRSGSACHLPAPQRLRSGCPRRSSGAAAPLVQRADAVHERLRLLKQGLKALIQLGRAVEELLHGVGQLGEGCLQVVDRLKVAVLQRAEDGVRRERQGSCRVRSSSRRR